MKTAEELQKQLEDAHEALSFYADPQSYFGVMIVGDDPTGGFDEDVSDCGALGKRHGATARKYMDKYNLEVIYVEGEEE